MPLFRDGAELTAKFVASDIRRRTARGTASSRYTNTTEPSRATRRLPHPSRMPARATLGGAPTPSHHARRAQRNAKRHCLTFSFTSASSTRSDTFIYRVPVEMQTRRRFEFPMEMWALGHGECSKDTPLCFHWSLATSCHSPNK